MESDNGQGSSSPADLGSSKGVFEQILGSGSPQLSVDPEQKEIPPTEPLTSTRPHSQNSPMKPSRADPAPDTRSAPRFGQSNRSSSRTPDDSAAVRQQVLSVNWSPVGLDCGGLVSVP
ncbi:hypothetical protein N7494_007393 [Penicillium frequentans]|uniref:Uncharacterized protein n=1 Tax=Penicillium frequentans TaxID=3151616 RepID=A0AAD6GE53_9EURO|nr:hypothetical protein N7494_007393 [Penicillium glabrum]